MSRYNIINGFNPACIWILPMLGRPSDDYPEFRDCFISDDRKNIVVYVHKSEEMPELTSDDNYIRTYLDPDNSNYRFYEFHCPDKWLPDFESIISGKTTDISDDYRQLLKEFYPEYSDLFEVHRNILYTPEPTLYTGN